VLVIGGVVGASVGLSVKGASVGAGVTGCFVGLPVGILVGVIVRPKGAVATGGLVAPGDLVGFVVALVEGFGEMVGLMPVGCPVVGSRKKNVGCSVGFKKLSGGAEMNNFLTSYGSNIICCSVGTSVGGVDRSKGKGMNLNLALVGSVNMSLLESVLGSIAATFVQLSCDFLIQTFDGIVFLETIGFMDERGESCLENTSRGSSSLVFCACDDRYWTDAVNADDCSKFFAE
jgi:hypothetical protein